jgi:tRNA(Ile)-lysidine synthase
VERFRRELERLRPEGGRLGLAVSGGPDSLAMLLLAEAAIPGQFQVATVDHGLRAESADECAMVARICAERRIGCEVLQVTVEPGNLQAAAREARYAALGRWARERGLSAVATAHQADDQAETLLMRLNRGSGAAGLAGVRARGTLPNSNIALVRPVLAFRRSELAGVVSAAGLGAVDDPSNADERFDRVRMRRAVEGADWLDARSLAASAAHLADADEALDWAARREWDEHVVRSEGALRYRCRAPRAVTLKVVQRVIASLGGRPRGQDLAGLIERLDSGVGGNVAGVLATVEGDEWAFRREPPRRTG